MILDIHPGIRFEGWDLKWWTGAVLDSKSHDTKKLYDNFS